MFVWHGSIYTKWCVLNWGNTVIWIFHKSGTGKTRKIQMTSLSWVMKICIINSNVGLGAKMQMKYNLYIFYRRLWFIANHIVGNKWKMLSVKCAPLSSGFNVLKIPNVPVIKKWVCGVKMSSFVSHTCKSRPTMKYIPWSFQFFYKKCRALMAFASEIFRKEIITVSTSMKSYNHTV